MQDKPINNAETSASQDFTVQMQELVARMQTLVEQYKELMIEKNVIPQQTAIKDQQIAIKDQQIAIKDQQIAALLQQYKLLQPLAPKLKQAENAAFSPAEVQQLTDTYTAAKQFITSYAQLPPAHKERLANLQKQSKQVIEVLAKCRIDMNAGQQEGVQMVGKTAEGQNAPTVKLLSPASSPVQLKEETSYLVKAEVTSTGTGLSVAYTFTTDGKSQQGALALVDGTTWEVRMITTGTYGAVDVTITATDSNGSGTAVFQYNRAATPPTANGQAFLDALRNFETQTMTIALATPMQDETANIPTYTIEELRNKLNTNEAALNNNYLNYLNEAFAMQAYLTELNVTWDGLLSQCTWETMSVYKSNNKNDNPLFEKFKSSQSLGLGADWCQLLSWACKNKTKDAASPFAKEWKARVDIIQKNIELIRAAIAAWEQAETIRQKQAEAAAEAHLKSNAAPVAPQLLALATALSSIEKIEPKYKHLTADDFSNEVLDKLYTDETKRKEFVDDVTEWESNAAEIITQWTALGQQLSLHYAANTKKKTINQIENQTKTQIDTNLLKLAEFKTAVGSYFFEVFNKLNNSVYRTSISKSPLLDLLKNKKEVLSKFNATTNTLEIFELDVNGIPVSKIDRSRFPTDQDVTDTMVTTDDFAKHALAQQGDGDTHVISPDDVKQNSIGDCYFLGSMAGIAKAMPATIYDAANPQNSIVSPKLSEGSPVLAGGLPVYVVKLYVPTDNGKRTRIEVEVTGEVPQIKTTITGGSSGNHTGGSFGDQTDFKMYGASNKPESLSNGIGKEQDLWVMLIEKAFAQVRAGYPNIETGNPKEAMAYLLGDAYTVTEKPISAFATKADLDTAIKAATKKPNEESNEESSKTIIQMSTAETVPGHLVKTHSYLFEHITTNGYMLRNPHNNESSTTNEQPLIEVPFDDLKQYFRAIFFTAK